MTSNATRPATPAAVADVAAGKVRDIENGHTLLPEQAALSDQAPSGQIAAEGGDPRLPEGTMVSERYRITRVLGEGGMGVVYAAEHVLMRKEVALKVLHAEMCSNPEVVARFEREAIAAAHIDHPNVAGATDFGRLHDGSCFLVLELLRGSSLRDEIKKGAIPLDRALFVLRGIVSGVAAAHAKGIVHRDLKPENVMLVDREGTTDFVKVLDFGIAKVDASVSEGAGKVLTRVGSVFGTPEYMAPEQALGDTVDARADLYSLGVIFLEMLTGKCPFNGNALSILRERILAEGPPDMSAINDPAARGLITRLLTRQPADRMQTASELLATIDALAGGSAPMRASLVRASMANPVRPSDVVATSATVIGSSPPPPFARARIAAVAAAALLVGILGVIAFSRTSQPTAKAMTTEATASSSTPAAPASAAPAESAQAAADVDEDDDPPPAPTASAASARSAPKAKPAPRRKTQAPARKTGPGGIYVPPPNTWFK